MAMGNTDEFKTDGAATLPYRSRNRRSSRRSSNPNVIEYGPFRRPSNSSFFDCRSLRRPSAPSTSCVQGMKPPIPPNVREVRKRPMRHLSKECMSSDDGTVSASMDENEAPGSLQNMVMPLSSEVDDSSSVVVGHGSLTAGSVSGRNLSPNSETGHLDTVSELSRNHANLEMNHRGPRNEDPAGGAFHGELPNRVTGQANAFSSRVAGLRGREQRAGSENVIPGRIQYDRNFLLQLQFQPESVRRPASLPSLPDIVLDGPYIRNEKPLFPPQQRKGYVDLTPTYARTSPGSSVSPPGGNVPLQRMSAGPGRGPSRNSARRLMHVKDQGPPRKVIQVSLQHNVQLHTSDNAWKPVKKKKVPTATLR